MRTTPPHLGDATGQGLRFLKLVAVFYSAAHVVPALMIWAAALFRLIS